MLVVNFFSLVALLLLVTPARAALDSKAICEARLSSPPEPTLSADWYRSVGAKELELKLEIRRSHQVIQLAAQIAGDFEQNGVLDSEALEQAGKALPHLLALLVHWGVPLSALDAYLSQALVGAPLTESFTTQGYSNILERPARTQPSEVFPLKHRGLPSFWQSKFTYLGWAYRPEFWVRGKLPIWNIAARSNTLGEFFSGARAGPAHRGQKTEFSLQSAALVSGYEIAFMVSEGLAQDSDRGWFDFKYPGGSTRVCKHLSDEDYSLLTRAYENGQVREVLEMRAYLSDRTAIKSLIAEGDYDSVSASDFAIGQFYLLAALAARDAGARVEAIEDVHNHPAEPIYFGFEGRIRPASTYWDDASHYFASFSREDILVSQAMSRDWPGVDRYSTVLSGARPETVSRYEYRVAGTPRR